MSQTYSDIPSSTTLTDSRQPLLDRDEAVRSAFSGSSAPTSPVLGQFWFDTDDSSLYQCTQITPSVVWRIIPFGLPVAIAQGGHGSTTAGGARTALGLGTLATRDATAIDLDLTQSSTGFIKIASGTDAQRPASPANGMIRYSTTQSTLEGYIAGQWQPVGSTTYNNKLVQRFNGAGGTGTQVVSLSSNPGSINNIDVYFSGVYQQKDQISLSGTSLTIPVAPSGTGNIEVVYGVPLSLGIPADVSVSTAKLIDAAATLAKLDRTGTAGTVLTAGGAGVAPSWQAPVSFDAGTKMLFAQSAAPTGWTKDATHNNKALRVVSGTASSGGTVAFTTAFASQTPAGTVGSTTLTAAQMPSHTHLAGGSNGYTQVSAAKGYVAVRGTGATGTATSSAGSDGSHNHTFTGTAIDLAVQYVDVIIATKD